MSNKQKIIVILGPTASGKTKLAVALARQFSGEIISADSRQVYVGLDIGSGKDLIEYGEIKYHLIDVADPKEVFSVAQYQKQAYQAIKDILKGGKLPIIAGGSGQYLEALVENYQLSDTKPDLDFRNELEEKTAEELFADLEEINFKFASALNNSERNNKRRLVRYLEVLNSKQDFKFQKNKAELPYEFLLLGISLDKEKLAERIHQRLITRLEKEGMIQEVSDLHDKKSLTWERLESFGLEYKFVAKYLQEKIEYEQMVEMIEIASRQFVKKQLTWFKRWEKNGAKINWVEDSGGAEKLIKEFLDK